MVVGAWAIGSVWLQPPLPPGQAACGMPVLAGILLILIGPPVGGVVLFVIGAVLGAVCDIVSLLVLLHSKHRGSDRSIDGAQESTENGDSG